MKCNTSPTLSPPFNEGPFASGIDGPCRILDANVPVEFTSGVPGLDLTQPGAKGRLSFLNENGCRVPPLELAIRTATAQGSQYTSVGSLPAAAHNLDVVSTGITVPKDLDQTHGEPVLVGSAVTPGDCGGGYEIIGEWAFNVAPDRCAAHATVDGAVRYVTGATRVRYGVRGIPRGCGPVTIDVGGRVVGHGSGSGEARIPKRTCKALITVHFKHGTIAKALGEGSDGKVIFARGDATGPDGERLRTGDDLCAAEHGARYTFADPHLEQAPITQLPRYPGYFSAIARSLERDLKLRVGKDGALWFGIGTFASEVTHADPCSAEGPCNFGAGTPITGGVLDVPAIHTRVIGAITARRLVLGVGHGQTVTLRPPEPAPAVFFPPGRNFYEGRPNLTTITSEQIHRDFDCTGFVVINPTRETVLGAAKFGNCFVSANGQIDLHRNLTGVGALLARGNIIVRGRTDLTTDSLLALTTPGTISLLGTTH